MLTAVIQGSGVTLQDKLLATPVGNAATDLRNGGNFLHNLPPQFITDCNSEGTIEIGPSLPKKQRNTFCGTEVSVPLPRYILHITFFV